MVRAIELAVLRCPHLVLTDFGRDDRPMRGDLSPQTCNGVLGEDHVALLTVTEAIARAPSSDLFPPEAESSGHHCAKRVT